MSITLLILGVGGCSIYESLSRHGEESKKHIRFMIGPIFNHALLHVVYVRAPGVATCDFLSILYTTVHST